MKLKTLKDFQKTNDEWGTWTNDKDIKKEAIKWIKHFEQVGDAITIAAICYFQDFFNITEEDLK